MKGNPLIGAGYLIRGFGLIWQPGVKRFVIGPLLLNSLVFLLVFVWLYAKFVDWTERFSAWLPEWLNWAGGVLWLLFGLALVLSVAYLFTTVALLIAAPFNGLLAEQVEYRLSGMTAPPLPWKRMLGEMWANVLRTLQTLLYFLRFGAPLLVLSLLPLFNLLAVPLWLLFSAWYLSIQYLDIPLSNHRIPFAQVRRWAAEQRLSSFGFGGLTLFCSMIPLLNLLVVPAAVAGATVFWVEQGKVGGDPAMAGHASRNAASPGGSQDQVQASAPRAVP